MATSEARRTPDPGAIRSRAREVDRHVGLRMRERRLTLGLTVQEVAELTGVAYQQVDKYERGVNRVFAGHLRLIAEALGVGVGHFFEGLCSGRAPGMPELQHRTLELARNVAALPSRRQQAALCALARALAEE